MTLTAVFVVLAMCSGFDLVTIDGVTGAEGIAAKLGAVQAWGTLCTTVAAIGVGYTAARAAKKIKEAGAA